MNLIKQFIKLIMSLAAILGILIFVLYMASIGKAVAG